MQPNRESTLGLSTAEITWLRANMSSDATAKQIVNQYNMVVACPSDPGARGIFEAMLTDARKGVMAGLQ